MPKNVWMFAIEKHKAWLQKRMWFLLEYILWSNFVEGIANLPKAKIFDWIIMKNILQLPLPLFFKKKWSEEGEVEYNMTDDRI